MDKRFHRTCLLHLACAPVMWADLTLEWVRGQKGVIGSCGSWPRRANRPLVSPTGVSSCVWGDSHMPAWDCPKRELMSTGEVVSRDEACSVSVGGACESVRI